MGKQVSTKNIRRYRIKHSNEILLKSSTHTNSNAVLNRKWGKRKTLRFDNIFYATEERSDIVFLNIFEMIASNWPLSKFSIFPLQGLYINWNYWVLLNSFKLTLLYSKMFEIMFKHLQEDILLFSPTGLVEEQNQF